ncbi:cell surface protein [Olivibacter ginsenosidimutans]
MTSRFTSKKKYLFLVALFTLAACDKNEDTAPVGPPIRPITDASNAYVTTLIEYRPGPGQSINTSFGNEEAAKSILGGKESMVSLGAYGGYVVLGFDHSIINLAESPDFIVYGNALDKMAEPGVVWVMQDENGNGLADDTWYEIKGSAYTEEGYRRDYEITYTRPSGEHKDVPWKDNLGNSGFVKWNSYHTQNYYPEWIQEDTYTLKGSLLPDTRIKRDGMITSMPFDWGYADNAVDGDQIDIANAIDNKGNPIKLEAIDFVKIQTGISADLGLLGECSTEVKGVADLQVL